MLYLAVPSIAANVPFREKQHRAIRRTAYNALDLSLLLFRNRASLAHLHYRPANDRNAGDELIRESIRQQIGNAFAPREVMFGELEWGRLDRRAVEDINRNFDLFVIAGSGYFFFDEFGNLPGRVRADADWLREITCQNLAYGIGCNQVMELPSHDVCCLPEPTQSARELISSICAVLSGISVRDRLTAELIRRAAEIPATVTGDPVLFYDEGGSAQPGRRRKSSSRMRIGFNLAVHDRACFSEFVANFGAMCQLLKAMREEYSAEFFYICHLRGDAIAPLYFRLKGIPMRIRRPNAPGLPGAYRDLDLHICQMMHSSILSLRAGVPTVNLGYDVKNAALFNMLGLPQFCLQARDIVPSEVLTAVRRLLADERAIMGRTSVAIEQLKRERDAFFLELLRTMCAVPEGG